MDAVREDLQEARLIGKVQGQRLAGCGGERQVALPIRRGGPE